MNSAHVIATGGVTAMLAQTLVWLTRWPLQPMDQTTALAVAGLLVSAVGGFAVARLNRNRGNGNPAVPPTVKE